jgi:F0F1-type ATP synthase alpha subunit
LFVYLNDVFLIAAALCARKLEKSFMNYGVVVASSDGIVRAFGLWLIRSGDVVKFANNCKGLALNLDRHFRKSYVYTRRNANFFNEESS